MGDILVLNHDPEFLSLMREFLSDEGYSISTWNNIDRALEHARKHRPDLIIIDLQLERSEPTLALVEKLRRDPQTGTIPLLVTSTQGAIFQHGRELLEQHGVAALGKPFELGELLETVRSLIPPASNEID